MFIRIESFAESKALDARYRFSWWQRMTVTSSSRRNLTYEREGTIEATLWGHQLLRSREYLSDSPLKTNIRQVDEHELIFGTHYEQWHIHEHNRLIDRDRYRSRAIYSWADDELKIVEHHHEVRLEGAAPPVEE